MEKFKVTFLPDNKAVEVERDKTILSAALSAGIYINSACGGEGVCGRCKVLVKKGKVLAQDVGNLSAQEQARGVHLACASEVQSDLEIEIPAESRLNLEGLTQEDVAQRLRQVYSAPESVEPLAAAAADIGFIRQPIVEKVYLEIAPPTLDDKISDLERLQRQLSCMPEGGGAQVSLTHIRNLGELLRSSGWKVTAALARRDQGKELLYLEPGDTSQRNYGFCFDIGTTTVTGQLVDLNSGEALSSKATYNKQAAFGSDVISRIIHATGPQGLEELHRAVADDINEMIKQMAQEKDIDLNDATAIACAGNTTMLHLLLRIDPSYIRREPYVPTANFLPLARASEAELRINPRGALSCLPGVASYVGGDVTAGILACGLHRQEKPSLLVDIGTNGEVVLGSREFLIACAASAGPAFEGSGVSCGMRAGKGAIQKVKINPADFSASYNVIGGGRPLGICGSGYIDIIRGLLASGAMDKDGKIKALHNSRIREEAAGREFVVIPSAEAGADKDITVTEADIDNLKRAKAAIYAAISSLVKHVGLKFSALEKIFIAGGFGTYLEMDNAVAIGLLPDLPREKFLFVGNSSLAGARMALLSAQAAACCEDIARKTAYLELSVEAGYMEEYIAALFFPHTDLALFPNIKIV
jgi:uncharacterized 2Fe-2S/4Fe-4S cluster protein (DUF4445 family)